MMLLYEKWRIVDSHRILKMNKITKLTVEWTIDKNMLIHKRTFLYSTISNFFKFFIKIDHENWVNLDYELSLDIEHVLVMKK